MRLGVLTLSIALAIPVSAQKSLSDGIKDLAGQIAASATKAEKQKIAALSFRDLDGTPTILGTYLAESLSTHLVNAGLEVVERTLLDKLLSELKLQQTGAIDVASAKQVGQVAGVDAIITGSIANLNAVLAINCRLIDAQTGRIFAAAETMITRDAMVESIIGQPSAKPEPAADTKARSEASRPKRPTWTEGNVRVVVDEGIKDDGGVTLTLAFENSTDEPIRALMERYALLDENGDRWSYRPPFRISFSTTHEFTIPPQARVRNMFRFTCDRCTGRIFSVLDSDERILVRELKVQ